MRAWLVLTARTVRRDGERYAPAGRDDRPYPPLQQTRTPQAVQIPAATVVAMMNGLPAADRELLVQVVYGSVTLEAAAADRGVPVETIKSSLYSALRALRAALDRHEGR